MKRLLAFLLCSIFALGLVACGGAEEPSDSSIPSADPSTDGSTENSAESQGYDASMEHKFIATDIKNHSIVVFDLNVYKENLTAMPKDDSGIVWEWDADDDPNCKIKPGAGIDAAKYRYSPYYKKDVIIACSSSGWAGVIDYEKRTVLWEYQIGDGPHSIEMMPDSGDIVVACSSGSESGKLAYVPLSSGLTRPSHHIFVPSGHGVSWDPVKKCLWVLEYGQIFACEVIGEGTKTARLKRIAGSGDSFGGEDASGHALTPVYGQPGKYWVTAGKLWQFDSATGKLSRSFNRSSSYNANSIKGIAGFADGTVVETVAGFGGKTSYDWSCGGFRIIIVEMSAGKVKVLQAKETKVYFTDREFYKVHPFTKDYQ